MKKIIILVIFILFITTLTSCTQTKAKYDIPQFNEEFTVIDTDLKGLLTNNIEKERFEITLKLKDFKTKDKNPFYVIICYVNKEKDCLYSWYSSDLLRDKGLEAGDYEKLNLNSNYSNLSVVDYDKGMPYINGDTTLYIYYADIDDEIKDVFLNHKNRYGDIYYWMRINSVLVEENLFHTQSEN